MKKLLLITACTLGAFSASTARETVTIADKEYEITTIFDRDLGPGIHYNRLRLAKYPLNVNLLRIDLTNPYNSVETTQANERLFGTESLVKAAQRQTSPGHVAIAGANANFWCVSGQPPFSDILIGYTYNGNLRNGKIIAETNCHSDQWDHGPSHTGIVGITPDKKAVSSNNYRWQGVVRSANAGATEFFTVNKTVRANEMGFYNSYHGATRTFRPVNQEGSHFVAANGVSTEAYLMLDEGQQWGTAKDMTFVVKEIKPNAGDGCVGDYDAALVGRDAFAEYLNKLTVGEKITINTAWTDPDGNPVEFSNLVGGNAQVLLNNELLTANDTETYNSQVYSRTGYGTNADGTTLYIIVIDKSTDPVYGSSAGCNTRAMCAIAQHYGCTDMTNFDAGGSAQMFVMDRIVNKTTESSPRAVANGMFAYSIAPEDTQVARLEFYDYSLSAPVYSSFTPRIIAYNKYGAMLDDDFKDFTLSCPAEAGACEGSRFTAGANACESTVTATAGNVTVTKAVSIIQAQPQIRIKPEIVIDGARKYPMEVTATVGANNYVYNPADVNWTMSAEGIASLDRNGVLTGVKNGTVDVTGSIGEFTDATRISVEISDAAKKNIFTGEQAPADWKVSNTNLTGLAVSALGTDGGIAIDYTVKNARAPRATVSRDMRIFSLPDAIEIDVNPGTANIKQVDVVLKTADNTRNTTVKKDVTLTPNSVNTVTFSLSDFGDTSDLIMFPVTFKSLSVAISDKANTACHVEFPAIRAVYNNYSAGVEDITADNDSDAPAVYYDLQGRPVNAANLQPGIYLRHAGARTSKVIVK